MATIKLKSKPAVTRAGTAPRGEPTRPPVRGAPVKGSRPTLAEAQAQRAEREARYQEQLRQRFGDRPPEGFVRRDDPRGRPPRRDDPRTPPLRHDDRSQPPRPGDVRSHPPRRDDARSPAARPDDARSYPPRRDEARGQPPRRGDPFAQPPRREPIQRGPMSRQAAPVPRHEPRPDPRRNARASRPRDDDDDDDDHFVHAEHAPGSMRLSKRMSELGIASRREADEWIAKGYVRVDDQIVAELGSRVQPNQRITIDAKAKFQQAQRVTVLINKPVGYVSGQAEDGYEPAVVLVTPPNLWSEDRSGTRFLREHLKSLVPAGRLDIDSVGLLVLTQDGRIAKQLIGEDSEIEKEYLVRVATPGGERLPGASLVLLRHGLELDGEALKPAVVEWVNDDQLRFVLTQGKKRQIRRMCEAVGLQVLGLKRVRIGQVMLGDLPPGQWRYLRADEHFG
jgi:23S rRNA pseudouridine2604 synthase